MEELLFKIGYIAIILGAVGVFCAGSFLRADSDDQAYFGGMSVIVLGAGIAVLLVLSIFKVWGVG